MNFTISDATFLNQTNSKINKNIQEREIGKLENVFYEQLQSYYSS